MKAGSDGCKPPIKAPEEDKQKYAATEMLMDAEAVAV